MPTSRTRKTLCTSRNWATFKPFPNELTGESLDVLVTPLHGGRLLPCCRQLRSSKGAGSQSCTKFLFFQLVATNPWQKGGNDWFKTKGGPVQTSVQSRETRRKAADQRSIAASMLEELLYKREHCEICIHCSSLRACAPCERRLW